MSGGTIQMSNGWSSRQFWKLPVHRNVGVVGGGILRMFTKEG